MRKLTVKKKDLDVRPLRAPVGVSQSEERSERIPFRLHPRVFAALGEDLVTDDVVALIELVKNSYDANSRNVYLRFGDSSDSGPYLEILDDGCGMTKEIIEDVWCLVATPHKKKNQFAGDGASGRRVVGEKGLGRLSAARLGNRLHMITKAEKDICWEVEADWSKMSQGDNLSDSFVTRKPCRDPSPFSESGTGTILRIHGLKGRWEKDQVADLKENLNRLISPFSKVDDFRIFLSGFDHSDEDIEVEIEAPEFLDNPKYRIRGSADESGNVTVAYQFAPLKGNSREAELSIAWRQIYERAQERTGRQNKLALSPERSDCGAFKFEVRAWDLTADDSFEIAQRFNIRRSQIRKSIAAHKGISVYRDDVLVLPKSDTSRDWLGLNLRRLGKIGRLSTNQIVGYVSISADRNPKIRDTSDREQFVSCPEVVEFREILMTVVEILENERRNDRIRPGQEKPMRHLLEKFDAADLVSEVTALADEGSGADKAVLIVEEFSKSMDSARDEIEERLVYYSRLATIGTIAHMLIHEIRNRTFIIGALLKSVKQHLVPLGDKSLLERYKYASTAVDALEHLADIFSPLANRRYRKRKRHSVLEERINNCLELLAKDIGDRNVHCEAPESTTEVAVDPAELDAILLNLVSNAVYWMGNVPEKRRILAFEVSAEEDSGRAHVCVRDTGPGIDDEDIEKVFLPGITRKPGGIGVGLTVAAELVDTYGGQIGLRRGSLGKGACFEFDLPLLEEA